MSLTVAPGDVIAGKYRVERVLGQGGMGVVVAASHLHLPQRVAIKFLLGEGHGTTTERFLREARVVVRLKGDHVVRVLDVGQLEDGNPYMVMELLEGEELGDLLKARARLGVAEAVDLTLQVCEAIAEAHAAGIVHRDIKPGNVFLTKQPDGSLRAKVLDFGISKELSTSQDPEGKLTLTSTSEMIGSPLYMSPEQMRSARSVDTRTDIWALGALLYRMLTGSPPFPAETLTELVLKVTGEEPLRRPGEFRADLDPVLEAAILCCLSRDPAARFQSVADLAAALAPFGPPGSDTAAGRVARVLKMPPRDPTPLPGAAPAPGPDADSTMTAGKGLGSTQPPDLEKHASSDSGSNQAAQAISASRDEKRKAAEGAPAGRARWAILGGVLAVGIGAAALLLSRMGGEPEQPSAGTTSTTTPSGPSSSMVPVREGPEVVPAGSASATASAAASAATSAAASAAASQGGAPHGTGQRPGPVPPRPTATATATRTATVTATGSGQPNPFDVKIK